MMLAIVGELLLCLSLSLLVIYLLHMVITGLGTIERFLMVSWLIGLLLIFAIPLKYDSASETSNAEYAP